jgi:hypothetical protein
MDAALSQTATRSETMTTQVDRMTSKGQLTITAISNTMIEITLAGEVQSCRAVIVPLAAPIVMSSNTMTHALNGKYALTATEAAAIEAAQRAIPQTLVEQREVLTMRLANCSRGAFPGSLAHKRESAALAALEAFDLANPSVKAGN